MKVLGKGRNILVVNNQAELFDSLKIEDSMLFICGAHKVAKKLNLNKIHVCLYCEELRNITLIMKEDGVYKVSMLMEKMDTYQKFVSYLKNLDATFDFSEQNKKITGYASAIVEKLREGTVLTIIDKKEETNVMYCPDCGVQCDPNIPYCMECGAMIG